MPSSTGKRRLLFLHGMWVPPECYKSKEAVDFLNVLNDWDVEFVESPRPCPDTPPSWIDEMFPNRSTSPEWVNSHSNEDGTKTYHGLPESLAFLQKYLSEQPRFDIIAGHSNGALMASILSLKIESDDNWLDHSKHWKGVLLFNAPGSYENETHLSEVVQKHGAMKMPSIHVWGGPSDITFEGEQRLQKVHYPNNATIIQHNDGHLFPKDKKYYNEIAAALNEI